MRYIDGNKLVDTFMELGMEDAADVVAKADTLKDPFGRKLGRTLENMNVLIRKLMQENRELKGRIAELIDEGHSSDTEDLEQLNAILMQDNQLLRDAYRELKEKMINANS